MLASVWDPARFAPCPDCPGQIVVGEFAPITVVLADDDGFPVLDPATGLAMKSTLKLPVHKAHTRWANMEFDPSGFAPAMCSHGLPQHPNGLTHPWAVTWIRAKHLNVEQGGVRCPVCRGEPAPPDLTTPRNA